MFAVYKRELSQYFNTPIGYVFLGVYMLFSGLMFSVLNILSNSADVGTMLSTLLWFYVLFIPLLTMRLYSEERRNKVDQLLITSPLSVWSIVIGKFLAACTVLFGAIFLTTATYFIMMSAYGAPAITEGVVAYLGFFMLGMAFTALGAMISAMTENQVSAAVITCGIMVLIMLFDTLIPYLYITWASWLPSVLRWLSLPARFSDFSSGILSLSSIVYMISFAGVFLFLTVRVIEKRRWSES